MGLEVQEMIWRGLEGFGWDLEGFGSIWVGLVVFRVVQRG